MKNKLFTAILLLLFLISCNIFADLEAPAPMFATRQASPPCYIKMPAIPGFTFTVNEQIPPIYVRSYVQPLIGNCSLTITVSGLPNGLRVENENTTNPVIVGTPTTAGFFLILVTAQARNNASGATFPMRIN